MRKFLFLLIWVPCLLHALSPGEGKIVIHNRVLATVDEKSFSVLDVVKHMDMLLAKHNPQLLDKPAERYQFYLNSWRQALFQMIDSVLIIADSEGKELKIDEGEIRETLQDRFGPNVLTNLQKIDLTLDEAKKMIRDEIVVQQMTWFRINGKAVLSVHPRNVKQAFKAYCAQNPTEKSWKYQILTLKGQEGEELARKAFGLLTTAQAGLCSVADALKEEGPITVSQEFQATEKSISQAHKEVLLTLHPGEYSQPVQQVNQVSREVVYRIFHLIEQAESKRPLFSSLCPQIENSLIQEAVTRESEQYMPKLRERFGFTKEALEALAPKDLEPFTLVY